MYFFGYGILQWQPAFFIRSYGLTTGELGIWLTLIYGLGGIAGTYLGGALASRFAAHDERFQLKSMAAIYVGFAVLMAGVYLSTNPYLAFVLMGAASVGGNMANGPLFATIQTLAPRQMRAMSIAVVYLFANLIGMGLGPLITGALSDLLRPWFADESLRYALLILCPGYGWAAWHLLRASGTVVEDMGASSGTYRSSV